jgi:oxygen-independent coproporphyrinogen-3 oxidase
LNSAVGDPLSIYIHIPFCERKCIYCDFYSIENVSLREQFVELLLREIDMKVAARPELSGRTIPTIFFGGGTPSLLTPDELQRIVASLKHHFTIASDCEFTLECNPGTIDDEKLSAYRAIGVNRLSFGVQSFDAGELEWLGRIHDANQAREAIASARRVGFDNVSLDLIFALPNQTGEILEHTLREAIALDTDHISAYNLIVEPGTPLFRLVQLNSVIPLDSDRAADLFELVQARLAEAGFAQYEISNYAKSDEKRAKHNLMYWDGDMDYVSFGPSAHEFIDGDRSWNVSSLEQYRIMIEGGKLPTLQSEHLSEEERRTEALYLQLRSTGIDLDLFESSFGEDLLEDSEVKFLILDGFMESDSKILRLTPKGYRFCDGIVRKLLHERHIEEVV